MHPKLEYLKYDNNKFNFKDLLKKFYDCDLTQVHKKFNIEQKFYDVTAGIDNLSIVEDTYKNVINSKSFKDVWFNFIKSVIKPYFKNNKILIQKLPSINIIPSGCEIKYVHKIVDDMNLHLDSAQPFYHPMFEENFWLPMTEADDLNDLYYLNKNKKTRVNAKLDEIFHFGNDVIHGSILKNNSENTRISLDFKALSVSNYDEKLISDKIIIKRGKIYKQNEWYSTKYYYMEI